MRSLIKIVICFTALVCLAAGSAGSPSIERPKRHIRDQMQSYHKRQTSCDDVAYYFNLVYTALFTVNYIQYNAHPCDVGLISQFDSQGLNGDYALDIICPLDAGVELFGLETLTLVNDNLVVTLIGLFDAASDTVDPSRALSCDNINLEVLNDAGLPSDAIMNAICNSSPCSNGTSTTGVPSSSAVSATVSRTAGISGSSVASSRIMSSTTGSVKQSSLGSASSTCSTAPRPTGYGYGSGKPYPYASGA